MLHSFLVRGCVGVALIFHCSEDLLHQCEVESVVKVHNTQKPELVSLFLKYIYVRNMC